MDDIVICALGDNGNSYGHGFGDGKGNGCGDYNGVGYGFGTHGWIFDDPSLKVECNNGIGFGYTYVSEDGCNNGVRYIPG